MTARDCRFCNGRGVLAPRNGYLWEPCPMCGDLDNPHTSAPPTGAHGAWDEPDSEADPRWYDHPVVVFGGIALATLLVLGFVMLESPW